MDMDAWRTWEADLFNLIILATDSLITGQTCQPDQGHTSGQA